MNPEVEALLRPLLTGERKGAVAFDADGTLWSGDVGEELLLQLANEGRLPAYSDARGVYAEYERRVTADVADGFAFAAAALAGWREEALQTYCNEHFERSFEPRVFPYVRDVLKRLDAAGVEVWIVSASPVWPVRAGARALGIDPARVIGVECRVRDGVITGEVLRPVPTLQGKPAQLQARGVAVAVAAGNSVLDLPMLEAAAAAFVVGPAGRASDIISIAKRRGWPVEPV